MGSTGYDRNMECNGKHGIWWETRDMQVSTGYDKFGVIRFANIIISQENLVNNWTVIPSVYHYHRVERRFKFKCKLSYYP